MFLLLIIFHSFLTNICFQTYYSSISPSNQRCHICILQSYKSENCWLSIFNSWQYVSLVIQLHVTGSFIHTQVSELQNFRVPKQPHLASRQYPQGLKASTLYLLYHSYQFFYHTCSSTTSFCESYLWKTITLLFALGCFRSVQFLQKTQTTFSLTSTKPPPTSCQSAQLLQPPVAGLARGVLKGTSRALAVQVLAILQAACPLTLDIQKTESSLINQQF